MERRFNEPRASYTRLAQHLLARAQAAGGQAPPQRRANHVAQADVDACGVSGRRQLLARRRRRRRVALSP